MRRRVLDRDGWRCRSCGRAGRLEVDHIVPLRRGGDPWDEANLQSLCRSCHIAKTRREGRRPPTPAEERWRALVDELASADGSLPAGVAARRRGSQRGAL